MIFVMLFNYNDHDATWELRASLGDFIIGRLRRTFIYLRRGLGLMKTTKVNAYIMHIFEKFEILSIHATYFFKLH